MGVWGNLAVVAVLAALLWLGCRPACAFVVRVADGEARAVRGTVTAAFMGRVREACARHGVGGGTIRGVIRGRRVALAFSGSITPGCRQQLRNWWALSGWAAPRGRA